MLSFAPLALYHGPNPFSKEPALLGRLTCAGGDWGRSLAAADDLARASADWFVPPEDNTEGPADLRLGRFLVDWSLQALTFVRGYLHAKGCTREGGTGEGGTGQLLVWIGWHEARIAQDAAQTAVTLVQAAADGKLSPGPLAAALDRIWRACRDRHPDYQARIIMQAARDRGIPFAPAWGVARHWRFGEGARSRVLFESSSTADSHFGARIAGSKATSKTVLRALGVPTPAFRLVSTQAEVAAAAQAIGFPCVTKPIDLGGGKGVSAGLHSVEAVLQGFQAARAVSPGPVLVEAHLEGEDHRLMVVEGRFVAAIRREPPTVTGDGQSTIGELVAKANGGRDPRSLVRSGYLRPIVLDASATLHLAGQGLAPDTVVPEGQVIRLRSNANLSTGGRCVDVTDEVNPELRTLVESLARTLGLAMLGADYITTDIRKTPREVSGGFVELNTTPGLEAMIAAGWSTSRARGLALPDGLGPVRKTLIVVPQDRLDRLVGAAQAAQWPAGIGWAAQGQAGVAGAALAVPEGQGWGGVAMLLGHGAVTQTVLLASDRQVLRLGMPAAAVDHLILAADLPVPWQRILAASAATLAKPPETTAPEDLIGQVVGLVHQEGHQKGLPA